MNTLKELIKNNIVAFGIVIGCALIISASVLASGIGSVNTRNAISVTGSAERSVDSDAAKWTVLLTKQSAPESYTFTVRQIDDAVKSLSKQLIAKRVKDTAITVQPVHQTVICQSQNQVMYDGAGRQQCSGSFMYNVNQTIIIEADDVRLIKELSLSLPTTFSVSGVQMQSISVDFFYTKLADIRVELLEEASKNAKERAKAIAKSTGNRIGSVREASQGIFQVTQKNSTDISDYGSYDTSTIEKKITAVVRASFEVK